MNLLAAQAHAAATTADDAIGYQRRDGITQALHTLTSPALAALGELRRDEAWHVMLRSLHRQLRLAGISVPFTDLTHGEGL